MKKFFILMLSLILAVLPAMAEEQVDRGLFDDIVNGGNSNSLIDQFNWSSQTTENAATPAPTAVPQQPSDLPKATGMTLMIYLCGSNLENASRNPQDHVTMASNDLAEIAASGFNESEINVVVMAGGSKNWGIEYIPAGTTGIYRMGNDYIETLHNDGKAHNMGDPNTLYSFLDYTYENFPAEKYALILWDHGGGSLGGICSDVNFGMDNLDMIELVSALKASPFADNKLSFIGFDACLMASAEVANLMAPYAQYMIASEETEPGTGWDYSFLKGMENDESPAHTGKRIVDSYFKFLESIGYNAGTLTMSCIDLSRISGVVDAAADFFSAMTVNAGSYAQISRARRNSVSFGRQENSPNNDYDLVDLGHMVNNLSSTSNAGAVANVMNALKSCVVYSRSSQQACTGLSVYHPFYNKNLYPRFIRSYDALDFSDDYQAFITTFGNYLISNGSSTWSSLGTQLGDAQKDNRTVFTLQLNEAQLAEIGMANIAALMQGSTAESWQLVATQAAVLSESGTLSGEYIHTNLFVTDENGAPMHDSPFLYVERDDGMYVLQVVLVDDQDNRVNAQLICSRDLSTNLVTVEDVHLYDEAIDGYSPRLSTTLDNFASVIYQVEEREMTYDANGALLAFEDWTVVNTLEYSFNLGDAWQLAFVKDYLDVASLRVSFKITDVFNNVYMSAPAELDRKPQEAAGFVTNYDDTLALIEDINITAASNGVDMRLTARLTNRTDAETIIVIENVQINGQSVNTGAEVYGNGDNDGLLPEENQILMLRLPMEGIDALQEITFDMVLLDANEDVIGTVPVSILVSLPA